MGDINPVGGIGKRLHYFAGRQNDDKLPDKFFDGKNIIRKGFKTTSLPKIAVEYSSLDLPHSYILSCTKKLNFLGLVL